MTTTSTEIEEVTRFRARGFDEDVNQCQHCGKDGLKGTVRMAVVDQDGGEVDSVWMGVVCAARMTGRKASEIRTEASRADRERDTALRATHRAWSDARHGFEMDLGDRVLARLDIKRSLAGLTALRGDAEFVDGMAAYDAEHPEPQRPW